MAAINGNKFDGDNDKLNIFSLLSWNVTENKAERQSNRKKMAAGDEVKSGFQVPDFVIRVATLTLKIVIYFIFLTVHIVGILRQPNLVSSGDVGQDSSYDKHRAAIVLQKFFRDVLEKRRKSTTDIPDHPEELGESDAHSEKCLKLTAMSDDMAAKVIQNAYRKYLRKVDVNPTESNKFLPVDDCDETTKSVNSAKDMDDEEYQPVNSENVIVINKMPNGVEEVEKQPITITEDIAEKANFSNTEAAEGLHETRADDTVNIDEKNEESVESAKVDPIVTTSNPKPKWSQNKRNNKRNTKRKNK